MGLVRGMEERKVKWRGRIKKRYENTLEPDRYVCYLSMGVGFIQT